MTKIPLLARQPIFDTELKVVGYELLCRDTSLDYKNPGDSDAASSQVLLNAFTELAIEDVVGKNLAFVNFTRTLLHNPPPFSRQQLVVEVLEGQKIDPAMLHALKKLRERGFIIALDDFILTSETECLVAYADIIKLDVLVLNAEQLREHLDGIKPYGIRVLAEKIETYSMFEFCKNLGFDLFQGYFLAKPQIISGRKISENKQSVMQLLSALHDPEAPVDKIERMIASDTMLSFKLLRLVNSAAFGLNREVESLRQAIMLLGFNKLRNWVNLLALSNLSGKPHELSVTALTRARLCELLANKIIGKGRGDSFFTVGLLSTLDAFLDLPLDYLLTHLSLSDPLNQAMLHYEGAEGKILKIVQANERGLWNLIDWDYLEEHGVDADTLAELYLETLTWVTETIAALGINPNAQ